MWPWTVVQVCLFSIIFLKVGSYATQFSRTFHSILKWHVAMSQRNLWTRLFFCCNGCSFTHFINHIFSRWSFSIQILRFLLFSVQINQRILNNKFKCQFALRKKNTNSSRKWGTVCFFALRIAFWWILLEVVLHFFYLNLITFDYYFAASLPKDELISVVLALGGIFLITKFVKIRECIVDLKCLVTI